MSPSNKKIEIITIASNYHIEVNPSDVGIYDRVVIQELIKTVASSNQLNKEGQREFKVLIVIESLILYTVLSPQGRGVDRGGQADQGRPARPS